MFINTSMAVVIDPTKYPGRLVICVDTNDDTDFGVFSGRDAGFEIEEEMNRRQPTIIDDTWSGSGLECFEILREDTAQKSCLKAFHYGVIALKNTVYVEYPVGSTLILTNRHDDLWHVGFSGVTLILPDYGQVV